MTDGVGPLVSILYWRCRSSLIGSRSAKAMMFQFSIGDADVAVARPRPGGGSSLFQFSIGDANMEIAYRSLVLRYDRFNSLLEMRAELCGGSRCNVGRRFNSLLEMR